MKRSWVAELVCLTLAFFLTAVPAADATAAGVCTINGTINFSPAPSSQGRWHISPGVHLIEPHRTDAISVQDRFRAGDRTLQLRG